MKSLDLSLDALGIFELDDAGVIRYSSTATTISDTGETRVGENFFENAPFRNREELRHHFRRFVENGEAINSFSFACLFDDLVLHTNVTFTRAFETDFFPPERIVMLSIREREQ